MVKNPSPVRGGAADLRPAGLRREHARAAGRSGFTGGKLAVNDARGRLVALWPCRDIRMNLRDMVNKADAPRTSRRRVERRKQRAGSHRSVTSAPPMDTA